MRHQIRFIVGNQHVSASDESIRALIQARIDTAKAKSPDVARQWTPANVNRALDFAVKCHQDNRKLYRSVVGGR